MMTSLTCLSTAAPSGDSRVKGERWLTGQRVYTRGDVGVRNRISEWEVVWCRGSKMTDLFTSWKVTSVCDRGKGWGGRADGKSTRRWR